MFLRLFLGFVITQVFICCGNRDTTQYGDRVIVKIDSSHFVGRMHYSDVLENFDTTYNDTVAIYYYSNDSISYKFTELRHKFFEEIDSEPTEEFSTMIAHDGFLVNATGKYCDTFDGDFVKSTRTLEVKTNQLYYYDRLQREKDKEEIQEFVGKILQQ